MKISIITPCFNAQKYIAETIASVISQRAVVEGSVDLEYIICDGGSTDSTVEIAESILQSAPKACVYKVISEADRGMYDALSKGLQLVSGTVVAYINAGDLYHPGAFGVVSEIFEAQLADWITGYVVCYNERSQVIETTMPYRYRRQLFASGAYGDGLPHIQQESTFWAAHLTQNINFDQLASFKYAGDYYLWLQFSKVADLKVVKSQIGGFKYHSGQLSQDITDNGNAYQLELKQFVRQQTLREKAVIAADRLLWSSPYKLKKRLSASSFISYDRQLDRWR